MRLDEVVSLFEKPTRAGSGYNVKCPCHNDKKASLSINEGSSRGKAGIFLYCQAQCNTDDILAAVGLTYADISAGDREGYSPAPRSQVQKSTEPKKPASKKIYNQLLKTWNYLNADGSPAFDIMRFHCKWDDGEETTKDFKVKYWDNTGKEIWKKPLSIVPYNLPGILQNDIIYIVEGEKDADTLISHGLCGTTAPFGAGKWPDDKIFNEYFEGKNIIIFPDNDPAGRFHTAGVGQLDWENIPGTKEIKQPPVLKGKKYISGVIDFLQFYNNQNPPKIKIIDLPDNIEKGDVTDWLGMGHSILEMDELIAATPYIDEKKTDDNTQQPRKIFNFTDLGNKERFLYKYSNDIRYCVEWKRWLIWDGKQWEIDNKGAIYILAQKCVRDIALEAEDTATTKEFKAVIKHAKDSESKQKIMNMVELAKFDPSIAILASEIDANNWLFGCKNGIIDLKKIELLPFSRDILITKFGGAAYKEKAQCPAWENFLLDVFPREADQIEYIQYVQRAVGYTLTGDVSEQILFLMWGEKGGNGKGTFLNIIQKLMGDYARPVNPDVLVSKTNDYVKLGEIGFLRGIRFARASESEQGAALNEQTIKYITSTQEITGKFMNENAFCFMPSHKLWFETNHLPKLRGGDGGTERRLKRIDFNAKFAEELGNRDKYIEEKLLAELDGIFKWALDGLALYLEFGMMEPECVTKAVKEYMDEMDAVQVFMNETCEIIKDNPNITILSIKLYELYEKWCKENGEERFKLTHKGFCSRLRLKHYIDKKIGGQLHWQGIQLI